MAHFALRVNSSLIFGGKGGGVGGVNLFLIVLCPRLQSWTDQMKIKTPLPHFNYGKMAHFALRANSSFIFFLGGGGRGEV